jgi:hypothetical protein
MLRAFIQAIAAETGGLSELKAQAAALAHAVKRLEHRIPRLERMAAATAPPAAIAPPAASGGDDAPHADGSEAEAAIDEALAEVLESKMPKINLAEPPLDAHVETRVFVVPTADPARVRWVCGHDAASTAAAAESAGGYAEFIATAQGAASVIGCGVLKTCTLLAGDMAAAAPLPPLIDLATIVARPSTMAGAAASPHALAAAYFDFRCADIIGVPNAVPNAEQWALVHAFEQNRNIVCRAVAGAGKTTTMLMCACRRPRANVVLLTYSKQLQLGVEKRAAGRLKAYTYHSAAGRCYGCVVGNDDAIGDCVRRPPPTPLAFDVLMIDEAQDMTPHYFTLVRHLLMANPCAQVVVVGDELQTINEFMGARKEFVTHAPELFASFSHSPWVARRLRVSHRLTPATAAFVNSQLYRAPLIIGGNHAAPNVMPVYIAAANATDYTAELADVVRYAIKTYGIGGVFVLAASTNMAKLGPLADLVRLRLADVPLYVPNDDGGRVDAELLKGKLPILTFNKSKGLERPCVILLAFDESHFDKFNRDWAAIDTIPNILTVAATRASAQLFVLTSGKRTLRTIDCETLDAVADVRGRAATPRVRARHESEKPRPLPVSRLVRHQHPDLVRAALDMVEIAPLRNGDGSRIRYTQKIDFGSRCEDVSFVYGTVAPVLAEIARDGDSAFGANLETPRIVRSAAEIKPYSNDITAAEHKAYPRQFWEQIAAVNRKASRNRTAGDLARVAVARDAMWEGRHHIARQVKDYDWVDPAALRGLRDTCIRALADISGRFEVAMSRSVGKFDICGRADFVEGKSGIIWEFKCVESLCKEHVLQLACYLAIRGGGEGRLLSLATGETWQVKLTAAASAPLLLLLAKKAHVATADIFEYVADYDRRQFGCAFAEVYRDVAPAAAGGRGLADLLAD